MAEVTEVSIVSGIPTGGTGEVPTLAPVRDSIDAVTTAITAGNIDQVAHDAADSGGGNPVKVGSRSVAGQKALTLVAAADRSDLLSDLDGSIAVREVMLEDLAVAADYTTSTAPAVITDGTSTSVLLAAASGTKWYLTEITITNARSTAEQVDIRDGTGGTVRWTFYIPAGTMVVFGWRRALGGFTAATAVAADPSANGSGNIIVSINGFKSKI